jgi:hypothetical protein
MRIWLCVKVAKNAKITVKNAESSNARAGQSGMEDLCYGSKDKVV